MAKIQPARLVLTNLPGDVVTFTQAGIDRTGKILNSRNSSVSDGLWFELQEIGTGRVFRVFKSRVSNASSIAR